jgi:hypothetical protein
MNTALHLLSVYQSNGVRSINKATVLHPCNLKM